MTLFIFFALVFATIVLAILINRIVRCPILVALTFFSVILLIAAIIGSTTLVVLAVILGIIAFLSAFFDCVFKSSGFFRNSNCLTCHNPYDDNDNDCCCNNDDDNNLAIVNSNGRVVARINGNTVSCRNNNNNGGCGCGNSNSLIAELVENNLINTASSNGNNNSSSCGCCGRTTRRR